MKLLLAVALAGALLAGLFWIPISGRTLWQRAQARGLPQSAARAMSTGAHDAVRWAQSKASHEKANPPDGMPGHKPIRRDTAPDARAGDSRANDAVKTQLSRAHYTNGPAAPAASPPSAPIDSSARQDMPRGRELARAPQAAPAAHDHIVKAPPAEQLSSSDKQGLDALISRSR